MIWSFVWNGPETLSFGANWISVHFTVALLPPILPDHDRLPRAGQRVVPHVFVAHVYRSPWLEVVVCPSVMNG